MKSYWNENMNIWYRIEQFFKHRQTGIIKKLFAKPQIRVSDVDWKNVNRILIVRQHDQLGDFLLSTPVFKAVRQLFPKSFIAVVARKYTAALVENNPYVDLVIPFYENGRDWSLDKVLSFVRQIRKYDMAIVLNTVSHSLTSDLLAFFSGAPFILGSEHHLFKNADRNFFYNLLAPYRTVDCQQSERNLDIVRYIGAESDDPCEFIKLTDAELEWAARFLRSKGKQSGKPLVAIHPGAGKMKNRWPAENFAQVGQWIAEKYSAQLYVTWGPNETEIGQAVISKLKVRPIISIHKELRHVAAVLSQADVLLCNDTGVMHLAAAVGTPLVAVFGPTDPALWKPAGETVVAVRANDKKCESVPPEKVFQSAIKLLHFKK
ncbi:glycosyltransferase family 9 protein [candidate division KSB1 bacterium]|nr:glycosyltransferase family 9 protein [candidate division KSB1 bacterium]